MKLKSYAKKIVVIISVTVLSGIFTIIAGATQYNNTTTWIKQSKSNWCWAAAAEMSGGFDRYIRLGKDKNIAQNQVVKHFYGGWAIWDWYPNVGCTEDELAPSANYAYDSTGGTSWFVKTNTRVSKDLIFNNIKNRNMMNAGLYIYNGTQRLGAHVITIVGCEDNYGIMFYVDPATGSKYSVYYSQFIAVNGGISPPHLGGNYRYEYRCLIY